MSAIKFTLKRHLDVIHGEFQPSHDEVPEAGQAASPENQKGPSGTQKRPGPPTETQRLLNKYHRL